MNAQGYRSDPLSTELQRRIQERLVRERDEARTNARMDRRQMAAVSDGRVSALEWVLREAETMKLENPRLVRQEQPRWDSTCPHCGHVHQSEEECGVHMGGAGPCQCGSKVSA